MQISCLNCKQHVRLKNLRQLYFGLIKTTHTPTDPFEEDIFPTIFCLVLQTNIVIYNAKKKLYKKLWTRAWILTFLCLFEKGKKKSQKKTGTFITQNFCKATIPLFSFVSEDFRKSRFQRTV